MTGYLDITEDLDGEGRNDEKQEDLRHNGDLLSYAVNPPTIHEAFFLSCYLPVKRETRPPLSDDKQIHNISLISPVGRGYDSIVG